MIITLQFFLYILVTYTLSALFLIPLQLPIPSDKVIQHGGLIIAILGIWPLLRSMSLANYAVIGYNCPRRLFLRSIGLGILSGVIILALLSILLLWLNIRLYTPGVSLLRLPVVAIEGLVAGLVIAFIEETFFRGALYAAISRNRITATTAIVGTSVLYATLHFFRVQSLPIDAPITAMMALNSLALAFSDLFRLQNLDSFAGLLMAGILLAIVRERVGHLGWGIGLHSGWILVIKVMHSYTDVNNSSPLVGLVGSYDGIVGWLAAVWLLVLIIGFRTVTR